MRSLNLTEPDEECFTMLTPGALLKGLIRRYLPLPSQEGPESEGYVRLLRYNELAVGSMVRKAHLLTDEGSYFVANNAQTGIIDAAAASFVITTPSFYLANTADPTDVNARSIGMDYVDLSVSVVGALTTGVSKFFAIYLDKGNNYSSGGTDLSAKIWALNPRIGANASIAKLYFGALTTTTPTVAKGTTRPIVGERQYRMPVTASVPDAVGDRLRIEFGSVEGEASGQLGTTGALMANVYQSVVKVPPVVIPPGWSMALYLCAQTGAYGTGTTWLPEAAWWER
jgi:hypothetical protein